MKIKLPAILLHKRTKVQNSTKPYFAALHIWQFVLITYLLDATIIGLYKQQSEDLWVLLKPLFDQYSPLLIISCCIISIWVSVSINKTTTKKTAKKLNPNIESNLKFFKYIIPVVIISIMLFITSSYSIHNQSLFITTGAIVIVTIALLSTSLKSFVGIQQLVLSRPRNVFLKIRPDAITRASFITLGVVCSRIIALIGLSSFYFGRITNIDFVLLELVSLILLFSCKPKLSYFVNTCPTCRANRSVIFERFPKCPSCYNRTFYNF